MCPSLSWYAHPSHGLSSAHRALHFVRISQKTKRKPVLTSSPYQPWEDNDPLPPKTIQLGDAPLRISAAKSCNAWNVKDRPDGAMFVSECVPSHSLFASIDPPIPLCRPDWNTMSLSTHPFSSTQTSHMQPTSVILTSSQAHCLSP